MDIILKNFIRKCIICTQNKKNIFKKPAIIQIIPNGPRDVYQMDITEIPKQLIKNDDYRYLLCIIDKFSKLAQCYLLKNKNAESVIGNVKTFVNVYGKPNKIHTDNGKEFSNRLLEEYCRINNIQFIHGRPYHPQSQGCIEKFNMEIKRILENIYLENKKIFLYL
jgi:transposase InsO family protein